LICVKQLLIFFEGLGRAVAAMQQSRASILDTAYL